MHVEDRKSTQHVPYKKMGRKKKAEQMLIKLFPLGFVSASMKLECNSAVISATRPHRPEEFVFHSRRQLF